MRKYIFVFVLSLVLLPGTVVFADTPTPTATPAPTATPHPLFVGDASPSGVYNCPNTPIQGLGTVTPSAPWLYYCGKCLLPSASSVNPISTPTATPSPVRCADFGDPLVPTGHWCAFGPQSGQMPLSVVSDGAGTSWSAHCESVSLSLDEWRFAGAPLNGGWWVPEWDVSQTAVLFVAHVEDATPGQGWENACSGWVDLGTGGTATWHYPFDTACGDHTFVVYGNPSYKPSLAGAITLTACAWKDTKITVSSVGYVDAFFTEWHGVSTDATPTPTPVPNSEYCSAVEPAGTNSAVGAAGLVVYSGVLVYSPQCVQMGGWSFDLSLIGLGQFSVPDIQICATPVTLGSLDFFGIFSVNLDYLASLLVLGFILKVWLL